ncbi:Superfamily II DNA/RNA helicase [Patulibacter medicamentivorans]|uniref:Superfamily II DNA/RNA helicase n=1 Tax=Patulibacter medicamentivorans TaxID=1097667 RepID=H0E742_9ACTN|nr:DEAD/DEAH box helicase [Patulibacter medicamentivorans]EHN10537.1 Superfamily II DNA/RNA helicase [Patulibacter medicamentivorans]
MRGLLDHPQANLRLDATAADWLGGLATWHGEASVVETASGPRLAVTTVYGTAPAALVASAERPVATATGEGDEGSEGSDDRAGEAEADGDGRGAEGDATGATAARATAVAGREPVSPVHLLSFDADGVAVLDRLPQLSVDPVVMLAAAELRLGRMPAAATLRLGRDEHDQPRLELLPGWSARVHRGFALLPEAESLETSHRPGYRPGDAPVDPAVTIAVPADPAIVDQVDALLREHQGVLVTAPAGDQLATMRVQREQRAETIALSSAAKANPVKRTVAGEPLRLGGTLQPFQHAGVRYVLRQRRTFVADEQGLGKTVQALAAIEADGALPAIVVCPAGMKLTWQREAARWLPHRTVAVLHGRDPRQWRREPAAEAGGDPAATDPATAEIVVLNYEIVADHHERLAARRARAVVFDESHYCKAPTAKRTKAAQKLAGTIVPDGLKLALTGTPVLNQPRELTSQLRLIDRLRDFGSGAELARRFRGANGDWGHDRLHWHLRAHGYVRRLKADVLPQLPAKRQVEVPLELDNLAEYRLAEKDVVAWLRTQPLDLREIDAKIAAAIRAEQLVRLNHLRRLSARGKLPGALAWISDFLAHGEPLVVFAQHREIQEAVLARFPQAVHVLGDDSAIARDEAVRRFQAGLPAGAPLDDEDGVVIEGPFAERDRAAATRDDDERASDATVVDLASAAATRGRGRGGGANLIVCSMRAAAQGITLTRASNVAFLELDWTPAMHAQAEDRCHRIGQRDAVTAWYLLASDGVDREMGEILRQKRELIDAVVDGRTRDSEPVTLAVIRALRERGGED